MPNLSKLLLSQIKLGDIVRFTVKDYNDTVEYSGPVVGICDYETARSYEDVAARHQAMMAATTDRTPMDTDIANYRFIIVEGYDNVRRPFAFDPSTGASWFTGDEVEVVTPNETYKLILTGCNKTSAVIAMRILREQGYDCTLVDG